MSDEVHTGGCQCGAVRFRVTKLGRASVCYCRMCQKATAGLGGFYVTAKAFAWTRGAPRYFASSNLARRGFCADCGTPLTFESGGAVDLSIIAFDRPSDVPPAVQLAAEARIPWGDHLAALPPRPDGDGAMAAHFARVVSCQHPDHDTDNWELRR
ncbi:MAG: GFA family protein [Hyphomicrobiaceae bacterium]